MTHNNVKTLFATITNTITPCRDGGPEWTSANPDAQQRAARLCTACNVKTECLTYALAADERAGVWGGTTPLDRKRLRRYQRTRQKAG